MLETGNLEAQESKRQEQSDEGCEVVKEGTEGTDTWGMEKDKETIT